MQIDPDRMLQAADQAAELLKSIGNRHRLLVLCQLTEGERSVGDLAAFLGLRDSTVSQHLSLLRREGLVTARRDGQTIWYLIASTSARRVLETLFEIFCAPDSLCAPQAAPRKPPRPRAARS
ncbi:MAG TPA: metalloregulator ArsR/SmtB family transcription factor [Acidisphaera sp.]|nr:metalloregulator ArsR/SmtB family transcription factor [Acidisphaera sp.]